ncbi:lipid phosphate phosphatase epsilon 2, chloroplastic-like [Rutidosis leptorrhynchoides]|uniref:lipid phosphate phosphatase epsilon 2, chloroplastic-like n=1 Tax=Rutidosis leptorrhynchoides TaxID=125765 RepID=UPI003A994E3E
MITVATTWSKPIIIFNPTCNSKGFTKPRLGFLGSKSNLFTGFAPTRTELTGVELIKTSALKSSSEQADDEEEQEALVDGSSWILVSQLESTINRLSKWIVSGLFAGLVLWRHDGEALWLVMGSVVNSILSVALKRIFKQERPFANLRSDPGMPSSHAMSIFFIFTFLIMSIIEWLGTNELSLALGVFTLTSASYLTWLRVSQKLHTISQVVVGAILGTTFSILWYSSWIEILQEAFDSSLWVQVAVLFGAAVFSLGFLSYVIKNWFKDDR